MTGIIRAETEIKEFENISRLEVINVIRDKVFEISEKLSSLEEEVETISNEAEATFIECKEVGKHTTAASYQRNMLSAIKTKMELYKMQLQVLSELKQLISGKDDDKLKDKKLVQNNFFLDKQSRDMLSQILASKV